MIASVDDSWRSFPRAPVMVCASVLVASAGSLAPSVGRAGQPMAEELAPPTAAEIDETLIRLEQLAERIQSDMLTEEERQWVAELLPSSGPITEEILVRIEALLAHPGLGLEVCTLLEQWLVQAESVQAEQLHGSRADGALAPEDVESQFIVHEHLAELIDDARERRDEFNVELEPPPTCGPCCHGSCDEDVPPPIATRRGCAVDPHPSTTPGLLLVLLALGWRRRREG